jgi:hypothetical protein
MQEEKFQGTSMVRGWQLLCVKNLTIEDGFSFTNDLMTQLPNDLSFFELCMPAEAS